MKREEGKNALLNLLEDYWAHVKDIRSKESEFTEFAIQKPLPTVRRLRLRLLNHVTYVESRLAQMIEIAKTVMKIEGQSIGELQELEKSLHEASRLLRTALAAEADFHLQHYLGSEFILVRNQIFGKVTLKLAYRRHISERANQFLNLLAVADFLDVDLNWAYSAIALQLHEVAIRKVSARMDIELNRTSIEKILDRQITLNDIRFMPFKYQYEAFSKVVKEKKGIDMPELVKDLRNTRNRVLHSGKKPTQAETSFIVGFTQDLLGKLRSLDTS